MYEQESSKKSNMAIYEVINILYFVACFIVVMLTKSTWAYLTVHRCIPARCLSS